MQVGDDAGEFFMGNERTSTTDSSPIEMPVKPGNATINIFGVSQSRGAQEHWLIGVIKARPLHRVGLEVKAAAVPRHEMQFAIKV